MATGESVVGAVRNEAGRVKNDMARIGGAAINEARTQVKGYRDIAERVGEATRYAANYYRQKLSKRGGSGRR